MILKLNDVQKKMRALGLKTDSKNPHFKNEYLSLPGLLEAITPILEEEGLFIVQELQYLAGPTPALRTMLIDTDNGETLSDSTVPLVLDRQSPQAVGSAITYYRRYSILTLFNLVAEADDDANEATERPVRRATSSSNKRTRKTTI